MKTDSGLDSGLEENGAEVIDIGCVDKDMAAGHDVRTIGEVVGPQGQCGPPPPTHTEK